MLSRFRALFFDRRVQRAGDFVLAGAVLAGSLIEISVGRREWSGPVGAEVFFALLASVPLVSRRTRPLAVTALVTAGVIGSGVLVAPVQGPFETFVAFAIAFYSVGRYTPARSGALFLGLASLATVVAWVVSTIRVAHVNSGDWFPGVVWAWGAWVVGRMIRRNSLRTIELEWLTVELAAERDARAREAVTIERARIARELHDVIAHNISVMSVQAAAAGRILQDHQPDVHRALAVIEKTGRETVDEMRRMLGILRRSEDELALAPQPSLRDLTALVDQVREAGLDVDVRIEGEPLALPAGLDLSAYRIVQEALTNALKYAAPAHVDVLVRYTSAAVVLEIVDDGLGTTAGRGTGNGMVGMRERVALFGGELRAGRRPEGGWALQATLPVGAA